MPSSQTCQMSPVLFLVASRMMLRAGDAAEAWSNRSRRTPVAFRLKMAKLTPFPRTRAPRGSGVPDRTAWTSQNRSRRSSSSSCSVLCDCFGIDWSQRNFRTDGATWIASCTGGSRAMHSTSCGSSGLDLCGISGAATQKSAAALRESIERHARYSLAQPWESLSPRQRFECVSLAVRDLMIDCRLETERRQRQADAKHVYYL